MNNKLTRKQLARQVLVLHLRGRLPLRQVVAVLLLGVISPVFAVAVLPPGGSSGRA